MGALPLSLPAPGAPGAWQGWRSMVGAHGQPARCPVHCNPSKAAATTRWQHPSHTHTHPLHTSPNWGHICRPGSQSLGQGLLLLFLGFTEGIGVTSTTPPSRVHKMLQTVFLHIQEEYRKKVRKPSPLLPEFNSRSQLLKIPTPHLLLQMTWFGASHLAYVCLIGGGGCKLQQPARSRASLSWKTGKLQPPFSQEGERERKRHMRERGRKPVFKTPLTVVQRAEQCSSKEKEGTRLSKEERRQRRDTRKDLPRISN